MWENDDSKPILLLWHAERRECAKRDATRQEDNRKGRKEQQEEAWQKAKENERQQLLGFFYIWLTIVVPLYCGLLYLLTYRGNAACSDLISRFCLHDRPSMKSAFHSSKMTMTTSSHICTSHLSNGGRHTLLVDCQSMPVRSVSWNDFL